MNSVKQTMDDHIEHLSKETDQLRARLEALYAASEGKSRIYVDKADLDKVFYQAEAIAREMASLQNANKILYENRGRATPKKAVSSKSNGKLGGRPPKEIAAKKKRIQELADKVFLNNEALTDSERNEYNELDYDITAWENKRKENLKKHFDELDRFKTVYPEQFEKAMAEARSMQYLPGIKRTKSSDEIEAIKIMKQWGLK